MTDINELLDEIDRRLFDLQTYLSSDDGLGNSTFDKITIVDGPTTYTIDTVVSPPTALTITPGTFVDRIYADVGWTAPVDGTAVSFDVEWAKRNGAGPFTYELVDAKRTSGNSIRLDNLLPHQWYGVRVYSINHLGVRTAVPASGFTDFQTSGDSSVPGAPGGLAVFAAIRSLIATWNDNAESDVTFGAGTYRVQVSTNAGFTGVIKDEIVAGTIATFVDLVAATSYYVRILAIDSSGNEGPWSAGVSNTTGQVGLGDMALNSVGANQVIANSIASTHIATVGLDAGVVKFGTLDGNLATIIHLKANNIDTSSITTSTITLNGGSLQAGSPPTTGLLINSQGMRLYSGGTAVIIFDAPSGSATLAGNITSTATITGGALVGSTVTGGLVQTATSGRRAVLGPTIISGAGVAMYSGDASETSFAQIGLSTAIGNNQLIIDSGRRSGNVGSSISLYSTNNANTVPTEIDFNTDNYYFYSPSLSSGGMRISISGPLNINTTTNVNANLGISGNMITDIGMNDHILYHRSNSDFYHYTMFKSVMVTPQNGTQTYDGPAMLGHSTAGMGSTRYGENLLLRVMYGDGGLMCDVFPMLYARQGLSTSGSKTFQIDHPVLGSDYDLVYASVEGPRADLIYRGTVKLVQGQATINIEDFYGLTPGTWDKLHHKDSEQFFLYNQSGEPAIRCSFNAPVLTITSADKNAVVSWMVIAERIVVGPLTTEDGHVMNEFPKTDREKFDAADNDPDVEARLTSHLEDLDKELVVAEAEVAVLDEDDDSEDATLKRHNLKQINDRIALNAEGIKNWRKDKPKHDKMINDRRNFWKKQHAAGQRRLAKASK